MPIIDFFPEPVQVSTNEILVLNSSFDEDDGNAVYEIDEDSLATFADGALILHGKIVDGENSTSTTLEGKEGLVRIKAYHENSPEEFITRPVNFI